MKAFKILSIIFAPITILLAVVAIFRDIDVIAKVNSAIKEAAVSSDILSPEAVSKLIAESGLPTTGSLSLAITVMAILGLAVLIGMIFAIKNSPNSKVIGLTIVGLAILSILLHPSIDSGSMGGASPKLLAIICSVPSIITGLCLLVFAGKIKAEV